MKNTDCRAVPEDSNTPTSATSNSLDHHKLGRLADFYGDDPNYNPYEDLPCEPDVNLASTPQNALEAENSHRTVGAVARYPVTDCTPPISPQGNHSTALAGTSSFNGCEANDQNNNDDCGSVSARMVGGGANSVSAADGSVANSADLGRLSDLDAFTHHRHNPYSGATGIEDSFLYERQHFFQQNIDDSEGREPHAHNLQRASANGLPISNFEQTDRFVAEIYQYREQQEEEIAYYNQLRQYNLQGRNQMHHDYSYTQAETLQQHDTNAAFDRFAPGCAHVANTTYAACAPDGFQSEHLEVNQQGPFSSNQPSRQPALCANEPTNNRTVSNGQGPTVSPSRTSAFPFASDMIALLPSELACDPSVKKQKAMQPKHSEDRSDAVARTHDRNNNDNDAPSVDVVTNGEHACTGKSNSVPRSEHPAPHAHGQGPVSVDAQATTRDAIPVTDTNAKKKNLKTIPVNAPRKFKHPTPLQAMKGNIGPAFVSNAVSSSTFGGQHRKQRKETRFMPPPPPSLQAARVMAVCLPARCAPGGAALSTPGDVYYTTADGETVAEAKAKALALISEQEARVHKADHKTCRAEGEFAFLTKTPGTSDWSMGYGASYSATVAEGAPGSTFSAFDQKSESFQSYCQILMQWYSRVARVFGHNDPRIGAAYSITSKKEKNGFLRPTTLLPEAYFAPSAVPPCPRPELMFDISLDDESGLYFLSDPQRFVLWHDSIQQWWEQHVQPRTIGYRLHSALTTGTSDAVPEANGQPQFTIGASANRPRGSATHTQQYTSASAHPQNRGKHHNNQSKLGIVSRAVDSSAHVGGNGPSTFSHANHQPQNNSYTSHHFGTVGSNQINHYIEAKVYPTPHPPSRLRNEMNNPQVMYANDIPSYSSAPASIPPAYASSAPPSYSVQVASDFGTMGQHRYQQGFGQSGNGNTMLYVSGQPAQAYGYSP